MTFVFNLLPPDGQERIISMATEIVTFVSHSDDKDHFNHPARGPMLSTA
jgi:hypothetical protein